MKTLLISFGLHLLTLGLCLFGTGTAKADYVFTTFDVPMAAPPSLGNGRAPMGVGGINDLGAVVGYYFDEANAVHGFLRDPVGGITSIDIPRATKTVAAGINAAGQIVGTFDDVFGWHGYVSSAGSYTTLSVMGSNEVVATGISNSGLVTGTFQDATTARFGFLLDQAGHLTTFQGPGSNPNDFFVSGVNDAGQVVGYYDGGESGFLLDGHGFTTYHFMATGINNQGDIVGALSNNVGSHGILLDASGNTTVFDVPGASGEVPVGINSFGQISGYYFTPDNVHGFIATPVPAPSSFFLLGVGIAALGAWKIYFI